MPNIVLALILEPKGLVVGQRPFAPFQGAIEVPGGKVEEGESLHAALVRECREELGLEALESSLYFIAHPTPELKLHWFVVKPLSPYHKGIYPHLEQVALEDLDTLDWIDHNRVYLPWLKQLPTVAVAPKVYVYAQDDPKQVKSFIEAFMHEPTTLKKPATVKFIACYQSYVELFPDFMRLWDRYLVES